MNEDTKKALEESILHWQENLIAPLSCVKIGSAACALCKHFPGTDDYVNFSRYARMDRGERELCPVAKITSQSACNNTPWRQRRHGLRAREHISISHDKRSLEACFRKAAQNMLNTLIKIRNEYIHDSDDEATT